MKAVRARAVLGVWAPMAIGLFIIATSINFYFTATLASDFLVKDLESWRLVCSAGAFFVGGLLILSTYGRYTKTREARREMTVAMSSVLPPATPREEEDDADREHPCADGTDVA